MHRSKPLFAIVLTSVFIAALLPADCAFAQGRGRGRGESVLNRQLPRAYQEPAFARGYEDGYNDGLGDGRRGNRYDPAASRNYRNGDAGYARSYGSRDAYRNNYRTGFRQGYEDGYREATR